MKEYDKTLFKYPALRVLIKKEGRGYEAHVLELDLVASGDSLEEAKRNLADSVSAQIAFAYANNMTENIWHPAPKSYFQEWEKVQKKEFLSIGGRGWRNKLTEYAEMMNIPMPSGKAHKQELELVEA